MMNRSAVGFFAAFILGIFVLACPVWAANAAPAVSLPAAKKSKIAVVTAEESQVYEKPDLDAKVVTIAKRGMRLPISSGTRGEYAKFYKTRVNGKLGWILVLDVKAPKEAKKFFAKAKAARYKRGPFDPEEEDDANRRPMREMFVFTRSVSFALGYSEYKESINGGSYSANLMTYGLKLTGPDVFLTGPLMDVNLVLHYGAPDYYNGLSQVKPSGFILWTDVNLLLPVFMRQDSMIGIGAGPVLVVSNIQASQGTRDYGMWGFNLGANIELTAGMRFGDFSVRLDGKYVFEKHTYRQVQLSLGTIF